MPSESERDLLRLNGQRPPVRRKARRRQRRLRLPLPSAAGLLRGAGWLGAAVVLFYVGSWALRPHCQAWLVGRDIPALQERKQSAERERRDLEWQVRYARSEEGAKNLAREYGYVRDGEVPVLLPDSGALGEEPAAQAESPEAGLWERFMLVLCRVVGADPDAADATGEAPRS